MKPPLARFNHIPTVFRFRLFVIWFSEKGLGIEFWWRNRFIREWVWNT